MLAIVFFAGIGVAELVMASAIIIIIVVIIIIYGALLIIIIILIIIVIIIIREIKKQNISSLAAVFFAFPSPSSSFSWSSLLGSHRHHCTDHHRYQDPHH